LKPYAETYDAAVLFADISGFSALAEDLVKTSNNSAHAAENLSSYVGNSLEQMVASICQMGGDVVKFAGDAILVREE
jgi:class 3 adenylate cyclase